MRLSDEAFEQLVEEGIAAIPERFLRAIRNVAVVVEDEPSAEHRRQFRLGRTGMLFGLYEGVPVIEREGRHAFLPDKIIIFKGPMLEFARTRAEVRELVKDTVWHEIAHHFGMAEHEVRRAERRRKTRG
jgi:predicted Zn-dependent protease with MMP-like domain